MALSHDEPEMVTPLSATAIPSPRFADNVDAGVVVNESTRSQKLLPVAGGTGAVGVSACPRIACDTRDATVPYMRTSPLATAVVPEATMDVASVNPADAVAVTVT